MLQDACYGNPGAVPDAEVHRADTLHPLVIVGLNPHDVGSVLHERGMQFKAQGELDQDWFRGVVEEDVDSVARAGDTEIASQFVCHQNHSYLSSRMRRLMWPSLISPDGRNTAACRPSSRRRR